MTISTMTISCINNSPINSNPVMGQLVHEVDLEAEGPYLYTLDVTGFGSGLYSYRIDHNGFELLTGKFIIYTP